tara:strand:+ start:609 stop:1205 length:597 start_codon:yes stop_codon:yes gene_type:complete
MNLRAKLSSCKYFVATAAFAALAMTQLTSCNGLSLPIEVTIELVRNVEISATDAATGSAEVNLPAFCDLFSPEQLDALIRNAAGDLIADLVTITGVELKSTEIVATEGTFDPFDTATLRLTVLEPGAEPLLLGAAADNNGLGTSFSLTQETPVDLLNDLKDGQCGIPTLSLDGAGLLEAQKITFNASVASPLSLVQGL